MTQYAERDLPDWGAKKPIGSPYDNSQRKYAGDLGEVFGFARRAVIWATVATVGMIGFGAAYIHRVNTTPEHVRLVERDSDGVPRAMFGYDHPYSPEEGDIAAVLKSWVKNVRWISSDRVRMEAGIKDAYAVMDGPAQMVLSEFFNRDDGKNNPDKLAAEGMVRQIDVKSVTKMAGDTYRVDWTEKGLQSNRQFSPKDLTGNFTVKHRVPANEAQFQANPSGIYITEFYWSVAP
jgi:type IV secretory pathway TrbF-like protein